MTEQRLTLGTRGSKLALTQAEYCAERLRAAGFAVEVQPIKTTSERLPETSLSTIDQRDVFTRQLDEALLAEEIDLAVHSLKDVPTETPEGIELTAITARKSTQDVLVSDERYTVDGLPQGAVVATGSLRRRAQLLHLRADLEIVEVRGNVETRIRKMREGDAEALVLARAGLERLGIETPHTVIPQEAMLPAVGQGALAAAMLESHSQRGPVREALNHPLGEQTALAERAMMRELEGGCRVPVGASGSVEGEKVSLEGVVASPAGAPLYRESAGGEDPEEVGVRLARMLLARGAGEVLAGVREAGV